jgi:hypothetical protein
LLQVLFAIIALTTTIYQASHRSKVPNFEFFNMIPNADNFTHNFMTWNAGINGAVPFISGRMEIGMTDPAI